MAVFAVLLTFSSLALTSALDSPLISTTSMSDGFPCRNPSPRENPSDFRACEMISWPMCSIAAGFSSSSATVASIECFKVLKCSTANPRALGICHSLSRASVTVASVPSDPTITCVRSSSV